MCVCAETIKLKRILSLLFGVSPFPFLIYLFIAIVQDHAGGGLPS
jgi:hypothetical protein